MASDDPPPTLTREQVRRVDQIAIEQFGVPGIVLMENAARGAVDVIRREAQPHTNVLILCGGGNNGGDGLAIARHLHNAGSHVTVGLCTDPARYQGDALINWRIVQAMQLPTFDATPDVLAQRLAQIQPDLLVDAIFGTGLSAPPRDPFTRIAETVNRSGVAVLAIDLPSGLDCDNGRPLGDVAIRAAMTVTFVGNKQGFTHPAAADYTAAVRVVDIGCPAAAIDRAM